MDTFDLKTYLVENKLTNYSKIYEEESETPYQKVWDFTKDSEPKIKQLLRNASKFSGKTYELVKKEFNQENADKALEEVTKSYNTLKSLVDQATSDPKKIKQISKFIPSLKNSAFAGAVSIAYQLITGASVITKDISIFGFDTGLSVPSGTSMGDPTISVTIFGILIGLKLVMHALEVIASARKGIGALKSFFSSDKDSSEPLNEQDDMDFSDIKSLLNKL